MIKRIIFDIDNTLLNSKVDFDNAYQKFVHNNADLNIDPLKLHELVKKYCKTAIDFSEEKLYIYLNKHLNNIFTQELFLNLIDTLGNEATLLDENAVKVLDEISKKYEIYALSNFFYKIQFKRLNKLIINRYFTKIYGPDNFGPKPNMEVFKEVCKPYKLNECLIIGDNIDFDIKVPHSLGINVLYYNKNNENTKYDSINSVDDLITITEKEVK